MYIDVNKLKQIVAEESIMSERKKVETVKNFLQKKIKDSVKHGRKRVVLEENSYDDGNYGRANYTNFTFEDVCVVALSLKGVNVEIIPKEKKYFLGIFWGSYTYAKIVIDWENVE